RHVTGGHPSAARIWHHSGGRGRDPGRRGRRRPAGLAGDGRRGAGAEGDRPRADRGDPRATEAERVAPHGTGEREPAERGTPARLGGRRVVVGRGALRAALPWPARTALTHW